MIIMIYNWFWKILLQFSLLLRAIIIPQKPFFRKEIHKRGVRLKKTSTVNQIGYTFKKGIPRYGSKYLCNKFMR